MVDASWHKAAFAELLVCLSSPPLPLLASLSFTLSILRAVAESVVSPSLHLSNHSAYSAVLVLSFPAFMTTPPPFSLSFPICR